MKITTTHLVLETDNSFGETIKTIRKVYCVHSSTDRLRYIMEINGKGTMKQITTDKFLEMSKALEAELFSED